MTSSPGRPSRASDAPFLVVLTGGIASGKTTVSNRLGELGATIVDTDAIAREVVEPGSSGFDAIRQRFGDCIVDPSGGLDRAALRRIVFDDGKARADLEAITHPAIRDVANRRVASATGAYAVLVVPLLVESGAAYRGQRTLLVDCPEELQLERLTRRDGIDVALARSMLAAQATRRERLCIADDVIVNDGTLDDLIAATDELHQRYVQMSRHDRTLS